MPGQSALLIGCELLGVALVVWATIAVIDAGFWRSAETQFRGVMRLQIAMNQLSLLPYFAAGITILLYGFIGLYWLVPAILFSFAKAILDAWVLLVEIDR